MKFLKHLKWAFLLLGAFFCYKMIRLDRTVTVLEKRVKKYKSVNKFSTALIKATYPNFELPKTLKNLPLSDNTIIIDAKTLPVRNVYAPYNPSIIENENGYYLFFRYDQVVNMHINRFYTKIGLVELDKSLNQTEKEYRVIDTRSDFSEDPRVFHFQNDYYLAYNDLLPNSGTRRGMYVGKLDLQNNELIDTCSLELSLNQFEKNWVPFVGKNSKGKPAICFEYQLSMPRRILEKTGHRVEDVANYKFENPHIFNWTEKWGHLRGGTPARLVDGEYLAFFHSSLKDKYGTYWYVMGAYTFAAEPPYEMKKMSTYPLMFKGMYNTLACNTAEQNKRVLFPSGFAIGKQKGKDVFYLSCGENDSGIKILTLDKEALLKSLQPIE